MLVLFNGGCKTAGSTMWNKARAASAHACRAGMRSVDLRWILRSDTRTCAETLYRKIQGHPPKQSRLQGRVSGISKHSVGSQAQLKEVKRVERRRWQCSSSALALLGRPIVVMVRSARAVVAARCLPLHGDATVRSMSRAVVEAPAVKIPPTAPPPTPMTASHTA